MERPFKKKPNDNIAKKAGWMQPCEVSHNQYVIPDADDVNSLIGSLGSNC